MPTYFARKAGNINATDVWATTPSGTASAVTFVAGDVLVSNSFAIAINVSTDLGGSGQLRNDTLGGATAGGTFTLAAGVTLTANILQNNASGGATVVTCGVSAPQSASIVGNVTSPVNTPGGNTPINFNGNGTLNFTGNATGDLKSVLGGAGGAIQVTQGTLIFSGNATGGGGASGYAIYNTGGIVNITGNCLGAVAPAVALGGTGTINLTGQAIGTTTSGGGAGVANLSTGAVFATRAVGGSFGPGSSGVTAAPGISNASTGIVEIQQLEYGTFGMSPTSGGGIRLKKLGSNVAVFNYCDTAGAKTLVDATQGQMPSASNVRSGVSYASGALTGTCAVPDAGSVALGVPVDATTGTAVLTPADVQSALTSQGLTTARAGALDNLDAAVSSRLAGSAYTAPANSDVAAIKAKTDALPSDPADQSLLEAAIAGVTAPSAATVASAVRSELSVELARVDQPVSSRLAASEASKLDAVKAKTDLLQTDRLAQCSTVATTGAQLAAALS